MERQPVPDIALEKSRTVAAAAEPAAPPPTIVLINQISGHGHLDTYARLYSACLLDLGFRVVLLAENDNGIAPWMAKHRPDRAGRFKVLSLPALSREIAFPEQDWSAVRKFIWVCRRYGVGMAMAQAGSFAAAWWQRSAIAGRLRAALTPSGGWQPHRVDARAVVRAVDRVAEAAGTEPCVVFFLYLDMMADSPKSCLALERGLKAPWTGILFHPRAATGAGLPERFFGCGNALGAAFLNPHAVSPYTRLHPRLSFVVLPDVTDASVSPDSPDLARRIRERARGRTIVLLSGTLAAHKGVMRLLQVIGVADSNQFFFAIVGECFWHTFGSGEPALRAFFANPPENCIVHAAYVEDERDLNAVIAAADIIYAVYDGFRDSSNALTKAAIFEKPIVVSGEHLMGERVRHYRLGRAVGDGGADEIVAALQALRAASRTEFGFDAYRRDHSTEALKERLLALLQDFVPVREQTRERASSSP